jgi:TPR repeat protein
MTDKKNLRRRSKARSFNQHDKENFDMTGKKHTRRRRKAKMASTQAPRAPLSQPQPPEFILWQEVELHGLSAAALNGRRARIDTWKGKKGRFAVQLLDGSGAVEKTIAVRPCNLKSVPWLDAEEENDCPICMEPILFWKSSRIVLSCCGKGMCTSCHEKLLTSAFVNEYKCPMCRTISPSSGEEVVARYRAHITNGKVWAQVSLATFYARGMCGLEQSHSKANELWTKAAKQGFADAQCCLGHSYFSGDGVEKDLKEALRLFNLAAAQGFADGQFNLGTLYHNGEGVEKNKKEAARLYKLAAAQGHIGAQYNLGNCYFRSDGVEKDLKEAMRLFKLAAARGHAEAQCNLGTMYLYGEGVENDQKEAVRLYKLAAAQGLAMAQYNLGDCYHNGEGVEKDQKEAIRLYKLAAAQGHPGAMSNLGCCYNDEAKCIAACWPGFVDKALKTNIHFKEVMRKLLER